MKIKSLMFSKKKYYIFRIMFQVILVGLGNDGTSFLEGNHVPVRNKARLYTLVMATSISFTATVYCGQDLSWTNEQCLHCNPKRQHFHHPHLCCRDEDQVWFRVLRWQLLYSCRGSVHHLAWELRNPDTHWVSLPPNSNPRRAYLNVRTIELSYDPAIPLLRIYPKSLVS